MSFRRDVTWRLPNATALPMAPRARPHDRPMSALGEHQLSGEPLKNAGENLACTDLLEWLAILIGIDAPGHRLARFITDQAERKLIVTLAGYDGLALEIPNDDIGRRSNGIRYRAFQTHSTDGNVRDVEQSNAVSDSDDRFFPGW